MCRVTVESGLAYRDFEAQRHTEIVQSENAESTGGICTFELRLGFGDLDAGNGKWNMFCIVDGFPHVHSNSVQPIIQTNQGAGRLGMHPQIRVLHGSRAVGSHQQ